ncbi:MAG: hypothetical protein MI975_18770 [Cytophagales bacterium]|nr:hypothetical protein [Cytophagales bacterium]
MEWVFHIGIAQSIFSAFLLFTKRNRGRADSILAIWMIFIAFELTHMFLEISSSLFHKFTSNFGFYSLTFGPFLFLYVSELTDKASEFRTRDLGHFIPYILFSVIHLIFFTNRPLESGKIGTDHGWLILNMLRVVTLFFSLSGYSFFAFAMIDKHKSSVRDRYSYESSIIALNWLRHIIIVFIITYLLLIVNMLAGNWVSYFFHLIPAVGLTYFCFSLSYYGFNQPTLFQKLHIADKKGGEKWMCVKKGRTI